METRHKLLLAAVLALALAVAVLILAAKVDRSGHIQGDRLYPKNDAAAGSGTWSPAYTSHWRQPWNTLEVSR